MQIDKEYDDLMEAGDKQLQESKRAGFEYIYEDVLEEGLKFIFNADNPLQHLCMVYEMHVFYLVNEEYERCAVLKKFLLDVQYRIFSRNEKGVRY